MPSPFRPRLSEVVAVLRTKRPKNESAGTLEGRIELVIGTAPPRLSMSRNVPPFCRLQLTRNSLFSVGEISQFAPAVRVRVPKRVKRGLFGCVPPRFAVKVERA